LADWLDELETELNIKKGAPLFHIRIEERHLKEDVLALLSNLLAYHPGSIPVVIHCGNKKKLCPEIKVKPTTRLFDEVSSLLGKDSIAFEPLDYEFGKEGNN
jgi:hypothetical protein